MNKQNNYTINIKCKILINLFKPNKQRLTHTRYNIALHLSIQNILTPSKWRIILKFSKISAPK